MKYYEAGRRDRYYWQELWAYRELYYFFVWRDIKVRYKQTVLGLAWVLLRPLLVMLILTVVFQRVAKLPADGDAPYTIMVLAALLPWQFFSAALTDAGNSMVGNVQLISKTYFPKLLLPLSTLGVALLDFAVTMSLLVLLMVWYGYFPDWHLLALPLFLLLTIVIALGTGLWAAALCVRFRDVRFIIPFIVQIGLYISPVGFSANLVSQAWRTIYGLNPMVGVIDGFRWSLLAGQAELNGINLLSSLVFAIVLFWTGLRYFRATENTFADVI